MMTQAFYTGISGLRSNQTAIDVISDNLANISTTGYRGYNAEFSSLFENTLKGINKLPNPPRQLVDNNTEEFSLYYRLKIN